jgi:hypothetical protein
MLNSILRVLVPARIRPYGMFQRLKERILADPIVRDGPFAGMPYINEAHCSSILPKLVGTYEQEIAPIIRDLMTRTWDLVIDVGTAEGYYLVGLARQMPEPRIVGFELDPHARSLCRELAARNNLTERLEMHDGATVENLRTIIDAPRTLIIMDVEGMEDVLLDPALIPALAQCTIIVETHDCYVEGVSDRLCARFAGSHRITRVDAVPRTDRDLRGVGPLAALYMRHYVYELTFERLTVQHWLHLQPIVA